MPKGYSNKTKLPNTLGMHWKIKDISKHYKFPKGNTIRKGIKHTEKWKNEAKERMIGNNFARGMRPDSTSFRVGDKRLMKFGKDNPRWKGGKTSEIIRLRNSKEYRQWRKQVFEKDNYTCIWCGQMGGVLNADHIKPFSHFPELRFHVSNGRTLCLECHKKTPTFGYKSVKLSTITQTNP